MNSVVTYLDTLSRETGKPETEVMTRAIEIGLRQLWRERMLGLYLRGTISRPEVIEAVGIDWVELAERQEAAMQEDVAWGPVPGS